MQNFMGIVPEEPLRRGLNASGEDKYSGVGPVEDYIQETVQMRLRVQLMTNRKLYL